MASAGMKSSSVAEESSCSSIVHQTFSTSLQAVFREEERAACEDVHGTFVLLSDKQHRGDAWSPYGTQVVAMVPQQARS